MKTYLWREHATADEVPVMLIEWLNGGKRAMIETEEGATINVLADTLREVTQ